MDGRTLRHGAVGAVPGVRNPVLLARQILEAQSQPLPGGLVPPSFLAGSGAQVWAASNNIETCEPAELIAERSQRIHEESLRNIQRLEEGGAKRRRYALPEEEEEMQGGLLDTVGAVCVDSSGYIASAVSSGGLLLKHTGRVGQAAVYGCGCWAENNCDGSGVSIGVSTTGCGEHLIRTMFARLCARAAISPHLGSNIIETVTTHFLESDFLEGVHPRMAGALILRHDPQGAVSDLYWLHTTRTMGVCYMTTNDRKPQAQFSELAEDKIGISVNLQCKSFGAGVPVTTSQELQPGPSRAADIPHREFPDELTAPGERTTREKIVYGGTTGVMTATQEPYATSVVPPTNSPSLACSMSP
ncbi:putative threonine aspartase 1-like isoform X1 [Penaeus vannamei]|uniref:Putative threonine aspartase 1-like isoform X1 n=1 Tax=Penaeus vannamei TaxID=6689 RepID=A0A3R7P284_PENVA|nr:putative threonine aspartase 1-like isoform X1 [Penaeus vannamei]